MRLVQFTKINLLRLNFPGYANDIRQICEKKMVSKGGITHLGAYLASYDDVIGDQDDDETFMHNPLNVYNLIRHVAVGWPIVEQVFEVSLLS